MPETDIQNEVTPARSKNPLTAHLARLEAKSIYILREAAAEFERPTILYSIGKDSSVLLHLAIKAFQPVPDAVFAVACRHDLEVPRHDRVP